MANKNVKWTVIFDDKRVINQSVVNAAGWPAGYIINDDSFWNDAKWNNIHAIQFIDDGNDHNDAVEQVPGPNNRNMTWAEANLGDFRSQFIDRWDAAHLAQLQADWDADNVYNSPDSQDQETEAEKISRLGARPTSYTSP